MRPVRDLSVRLKLTLLVIGIVGGAILFTTVVFVVNDVGLIKSALADEVAVLAEVLGANSAAALNFQDADTAEQVLASLQREPGVVLACTYDAQGRVFAMYPAAEATRAALPQLQPGNTPYFAGGYLHVFKPISEYGRTIGTVYLRASLRRLDLQIRRNALIAVTVLLGTLLTATLLALRLQRFISDPILRLVEATRTVTGEADFSIRVHKPGRDELGTLCDAFNVMLAQIQERDAELEQHRAHLESLVGERTQSLEAKTVALRDSEQALSQQSAQLARANAELARSNAELEQFAYIASHDLQEPLRKVQAFGDMLVGGYRDALGSEGQDYLQRMQNAATRMKTLINDLLAYSRVTSKAQPFTAVDLNEIAGGVASDLEARLRDTGGRLEIGPLPHLEAEPTQMRQLLQNLIGNALKYHKPNEPPVVTVESRVLDPAAAAVLPLAPGGQVCELSIRDNGIGFEEKYQERIFAPFVRLHGRSEYEGTGMGLAVCRKIVERHGGVISARSSPGQGSTFLVTLPLLQPHKDNEHA